MLTFHSILANLTFKMYNETNGTVDHLTEFNLKYVICEVLVAICAVIGNALVIFVFRKERRLRRRTNYYIVSLAAADLLVGLLGIPFAIMASVGLPRNLHACLFTVSLLVVLCTISILSLVAVSVDRYWAILHPMGYSRNVRTKTALVIISICWVTGCLIGFLPLMGWHKGSADEGCFFLEVMDYNYLVFLYFGTIITPALLLAAFYTHIYQVVLKQMRQIVTMNPTTGSAKNGSTSGGTMLRMLGAAQSSEVKATQNLAIIVLFFMICWIPLYTINCVIAFYPTIEVDGALMFFCIILSHLNSAVNPLLYAYHLKDFRLALKNFFLNLFDHQRYCDQRLAQLYNNNYSNFYFQSRKRSSNLNTDINRFNFTKNPDAAPKISSIVKNPTQVAVATTGESTRDIWNITEHSESSKSSQESLKQNDKVVMIRPATPYRNIISSSNYSDYISVAGAEDVYMDEGCHNFSFNNCDFDVDLRDKLSRPVSVLPMVHRKFSNSSPQLSRNLFVIADGQTAEKPIGLTLDDVKYTPKYKMSPFKIFTHKRFLNRSLSDEGNVSTENIHKERNSCGS